MTTMTDLSYLTVNSLLTPSYAMQPQQAYVFFIGGKQQHENAEALHKHPEISGGS
jgi:hypothetical protein